MAACREQHYSLCHRHQHLEGFVASILICYFLQTRSAHDDAVVLLWWSRSWGGGCRVRVVAALTPLPVSDNLTPFSETKGKLIVSNIEKLLIVQEYDCRIREMEQELRDI